VACCGSEGTPPTPRVRPPADPQALLHVPRVHSPGSPGLFCQVRHKRINLLHLHSGHTPGTPQVNHQCIPQA